ncbi:MAG: metallophosphoesterase [Pyrinomonadaceae bacterium]|nr:metallophosphoesterase [Pyrinomonadaceae bacterium]
MKRNPALYLTIAFLIASAFTQISHLPQTSFGQESAKNPKAISAANSPLKLTLPLKDGSVRFAIIGDTGTGTPKQYQVGEMMTRYHEIFPFPFVIMLGDNMYGGEKPSDYVKKFEGAYQKLLDGKIKFYAALGNHDQATQVNYEPFNMNGKEFYRFTKGNVAFYALNSTYMDKRQVDWLESELAKDTSEWKICFFHHPPYSSGGKHGSDKQLREIVEPIFVKHGVNVVLTGHDHFYERIKPQKGIYYFVSGGGGKLREGDVKGNTGLTAKKFDSDLHFMISEVVNDSLYFQVISRTGETVDSGVLSRQRKQ